MESVSDLNFIPCYKKTKVSKSKKKVDSLPERTSGSREEIQNKASTIIGYKKSKKGKLIVISEVPKLDTNKSDLSTSTTVKSDLLTEHQSTGKKLHKSKKHLRSENLQNSKETSSSSLADGNIVESGKLVPAEKQAPERYPRCWTAPKHGDVDIIQMSQFLDLPESVRIKIFKFLRPVERILAQLVCRQFRNEIRLRVGLMTKVSEATMNGLTYLRDVKIDTLIVGKYEKPSMTPFRIICIPDNIQRLIIDDPIAIQYFDAFLGRCRKIRSLIVNAPITEASVCSSSLRIHLNAREWRHMETIRRFPVTLNSLTELVISFPGKDCISTIPRLLNIIDAPNLLRLNVTIRGVIEAEDTTSTHFSVMLFLVRSNKIRCLTISTEQKKSAMKWQEHQFFGLGRDQLNQLADKLQLRELILTEPSVAFHTWSVILFEQRELEVLQVVHVMMWPVIREIILNCAFTLKKIAFHCLLWEKPGLSSLMDLVIFYNCVNLKELYICIAAPFDLGKADFQNFCMLPKSLNTLALMNCTFRTQDLLNVRKLPNLKSLGIVSFGTMREYGITVKALRKLLSIRTLDEILISGFSVNDRSTADLLCMIKLTCARIKEKRSVFYLRDPNTGRWSVGSNGGLIFSLLSDWGFTFLPSD